MVNAFSLTLLIAYVRENQNLHRVKNMLIREIFPILKTF